MFSDFKFALRQLLKSPGFTAISIVTLALGIGLNTSMFSLMNLLLLQPLPYPDRDHLVRIHRTTPQSQTAGHSAVDYLDLAREAKPFADVGALRIWGYTLAQGDRPPVNLNAARVSANLFSVLGMQPELGRVFSESEDRPGNQVVILSNATWQAHFGGDPSVVGTTVRIDSVPTTIIGVMPAAFSSLGVVGPGDVFRPLGLTDAEKIDRTDSSLTIIARYQSNISFEQLNARLTSLAGQLAQNRPREQSEDGLRAVTLQDSIKNAATTGISWLMLGLAGFVLLIACANLANLQLARAVARSHEFAIRAALGASRTKLLRPLIAESLMLSIFGGLLGILVAFWANHWISSQLSANGVVTFTLELEWIVVAFALALSAATGLLFGIVPAWLMSRIRVADSLKSGTRGNTGDRAQHRLRHGLIVAQFALALVLLVGAGVFIRGLDAMMERDAGWDRSSMIQGVLNLPAAKYANPAQSYAFFTELQERLGALPGVESVAVGWSLPIFQFLTNRNYIVEGREPPPPGREPTAGVNAVTPSYLDTLKIKLRSGRNFTQADNATASPVVIINESMARTLFPNESPLGRRIGSLDASNRGWAEIVGVMPDIGMAVNILAPTTQFQVFKPLAQETWNYAGFGIRAQAPSSLIDSVRRTIQALDPELAVQQLNTLEEQVRLFSSGLGMINTVLIAFAILGLFLASLGLYGVIARLVVQRTPEIGVRVALGAQERDVVWLILSTGLRLTAIGTAIGLVASVGLVLTIGSFMPDMPVRDWRAISAVTLLLFTIALVACWFPSRRAARVDPLVALRAD
jgi:predicted permease